MLAVMIMPAIAVENLAELASGRRRISWLRSLQSTVSDRGHKALFGPKQFPPVTSCADDNDSPPGFGQRLIRYAKPVLP